MNKIYYYRCTDCNPQGILRNGSICPRCSGLGYLRAEDDEDEDEVDASYPFPCSTTKARRRRLLTELVDLPGSGDKTTQNENLRTFNTASSIERTASSSILARKPLIFGR